MSKLGDYLRSKKSSAGEASVGTAPKEENSDGIRMYNRYWLNKISEQTGYIISDNDDKVEGILNALNRRNGHCPCGGNGDQFLCPCKNMREYGICKCGLYENMKKVEPTGSSTGRIKSNE